MQESPIKVSDINPIGEREAESFFNALQCDSLIIVASRNGTWWLNTHEACAHDLLEVAAMLTDKARSEL